MGKEEVDVLQAAIYEQIRSLFVDALKEKGIKYDFNPGFSFKKEDNRYVLRLTPPLADALNKALKINIRDVVSSDKPWGPHAEKYDKIAEALSAQRQQ